MRGAAAETANLLLDCGLELAEKRLNSVIRRFGDLSTQVANYVIEAALRHKTALG